MADASTFQSAVLAAGAGGIYLTGEDNFRLTTWGAIAGVVVALETRIVDACGQLHPGVEVQTPNSDRTAKSTIYPACEGLLTSVQLRASSGTVLRGGVYAVLELVRGRDGGVQAIGTLLADYVVANGRLAWPGSAIRPSIDGPGRLRVIVGTDPAAGVEIAETVPTGARWRVRAFSFTLVTSASVATRTPVLTVDDGANVLYETGTNVAQTASLTAKYRAAIGVPLTTYGTTSYNLPLPSDLVLAAGSRIRSVAGALQGTDDYGAPIYAVEEWIEP